MVKTKPGLTEHLFLHSALRVVQMQEQLLEEELQMSGAPLGVVFLSQAGQPEAEGLEGDAADLLAAVVESLQQVCSDKWKHHTNI